VDLLEFEAALWPWHAPGHGARGRNVTLREPMDEAEKMFPKQEARPQIH
jgi:hypothetical protein